MFSAKGVRNFGNIEEMKRKMFRSGSCVLFNTRRVLPVWNRRSSAVLRDCRWAWPHACATCSCYVISVTEVSFLRLKFRQCARKTVSRRLQRNSRPSITLIPQDRAGGLTEEREEAGRVHMWSSLMSSCLKVTVFLFCFLLP